MFHFCRAFPPDTDWLCHRNPSDYRASPPRGLHPIAGAGRGQHRTGYREGRAAVPGADTLQGPEEAATETDVRAGEPGSGEVRRRGRLGGPAASLGRFTNPSKKVTSSTCQHSVSSITEKAGLITTILERKYFMW